MMKGSITRLTETIRINSANWRGNLPVLVSWTALEALISSFYLLARTNCTNSSLQTEKQTVY
jgi:hypothetical protein